MIHRGFHHLEDVIRIRVRRAGDKVAPAAIACFIGLIGWSSEPVTSVLLLKPIGDVGEVCFFVRP